MVASRGLPVSPYGSGTLKPDMVASRGALSPYGSGTLAQVPEDTFFTELQEAESRRRQLALEIALKSNDTREAPRTKKTDQTVAAAQALLESRYGHVVRNIKNAPLPEPMSNIEVASDWSARVAALRWRAHSERLKAETARLQKENSTLRNVVSGRGIIDIAELNLALQAKENELFELKRGKHQARCIDALHRALRPLVAQSILRESLVAWRVFVFHGAGETGWFEELMGWNDDGGQLNSDPHHADDYADSDVSDPLHTKLLKLGGLHESDDEEWKAFGKDDTPDGPNLRFAEMKRQLKWRQRQGQADTARDKNRPVPQITKTPQEKVDSPAPSTVGPSLSARMEVEKEPQQSHQQHQHHHHKQDGHSEAGSSASASSESRVNGVGMWGLLGYTSEPETEVYNIWGKTDTEQAEEARKALATLALQGLSSEPWAPSRRQAKETTAFDVAGHARTKRKPRPKKMQTAAVLAALQST